MGNDFFVEKEEEKIEQSTLHDQLKEKKTRERKKREPQNKPPNNYLPVKLSSIGKLNAPAIIYVRNYTGEDILDMSMITEDNALDTIVKVLNNMVFGGFDCSYLHQKEIEEILLNILINFWNSQIDCTYPYTEEELDTCPDKEKVKRIRKGDESLNITLTVDNLKTTSLLKEFEEPINITLQNETVQFVLPRVRNILIAKDYVEKKYAQEDSQYETDDQSSEREEYLRNRNKDFLLVQQAQLLRKHNSKVLNTLDEQIKCFKELSINFWKAYNQTVEEKLDFGVNHDIEVVSPLTDKKITRRFQFRFLDFVPSLDSQDISEYTVTFGEQ